MGLATLAGLAVVGLVALGAPEAATASSGPEATTIRQSQVFYAYVAAGENLDATFAPSVPVDIPAVITITSPTGEAYTCTAGMGTTAACDLSDLTSTESGIWTIDFVRADNDSSMFTWDVSVQSGTTTIPGRVWSDRYVMLNVAPADFSLWYLGSTGYLYQADYEGYIGIDSEFASNQFGNVIAGTCESIYRSFGLVGADAASNDGDFSAESAECGVPYHIFFEEPAPDLPASAALPSGETTFVSPEAQLPGVTEFAYASDDATARAGTFTVETVGFIGTADLLIDGDGNGSYSDAEDLSIPVAIGADGTASVPWDGNDALGDPVPASWLMNARLSITRAGEIHFLNLDVERRGSLAVTAMRGTGAGSTTLYWDDSALLDNRLCATGVRDGTGGMDSVGGVHGWPCEGLNLVQLNANTGDGDPGVTRGASKTGHTDLSTPYRTSSSVRPWRTTRWSSPRTPRRARTSRRDRRSRTQSR